MPGGCPTACVCRFGGVRRMPGGGLTAYATDPSVQRIDVGPVACPTAWFDALLDDCLTDKIR